MILANKIYSRKNLSTIEIRLAYKTKISDILLEMIKLSAIFRLRKQNMRLVLSIYFELPKGDYARFDHELPHLNIKSPQSFATELSKGSLLITFLNQDDLPATSIIFYSPHILYIDTMPK